MELTKAEVEHIARLARLGLSDEERDSLRTQLSSILAHVNQLAELDTEGIPPTAQVTMLQDVLAADEPRPSLPPDEILANAPDHEGDYYRVKTVLGYET